ncbi:MAG TPA: carbon storage regulator CsrA [Anaerolineales bacterium]
MLVLSRQVDESIVIDDNIVITVLSVEGDRVKIGIRAPREIIILRYELWQAMKEQEQIAADLASRPDPKSLKGLRDFLADEAEDAPD